MVDQELRRAAAELRTELQRVDPPPFKPRSSQLGGRAVLVAATVAVCVFSFALFRSNTSGNLESEVGPAETAVNTDDSSESDGGESDDGESQNGEPDGGTPDGAVSGLDDLGLQLDFSQLQVTDRQHRPVSPMEAPEQGQNRQEPDFGTAIAAVTAAPSGGTISPIPEGTPSWNADGSLIILYESGTLDAGHALYDGVTLERIGALPIVPRDIEELFWDPQYPNRIYYTEANRLLAYDVDTASVDNGVVGGSRTMVHQFSDCGEIQAPLTTKPISAVGQMMGLLCVGSGDGAEDTAAPQWIALDLVNDVERRAAASSAQTPQPTPSGTRFVVMEDDGRVLVLDDELNPTEVSFTVDSNPTKYVLVGTQDGRELLVTTIFGGEQEETGSVVGFDLSSGERTVAVGPATGFSYPPGGTELSAPLGRTGLVAVSVAGMDNPEDQDTLDGELLLVDFNQVVPDTYRLGHHRSSRSGDDFTAYWSRSGVSVDRAGTKFLFSSHWGRDSLDTFIIDISARDD